MVVSSTGLAKGPAQALFEIKSGQLPLVCFLLKTSDCIGLARELRDKFSATGESPNFFDHDPVLLDFSQLASDELVPDLDALLQAMRECNLVPVAARGSNTQWIAATRAFGLVEAAPEVHKIRPLVETMVQVETVVKEVVREIAAPTTMVVEKPLRSGQKIYARGADLVVLAMVNQGAEVVADGNIHVYAPLRGKAMAGARGNTQARIFSLCLEPELISIAGVYRTSENALPDDVRGKAAQVRLSNDGQDKLIIESLKN